MLVCCGGLRGVFGSVLRVSFAFGLSDIACENIMDAHCKQRAIARGGVGHEPSRSPRKKARREASGGVSVASEPSLQAPPQKRAASERA